MAGWHFETTYCYQSNISVLPLSVISKSDWCCKNDSTCLLFKKILTWNVFGFSDQLLSLCLLSFESLNTARSKDLCLASIEEAFFTPLWGPLVALFRYSWQNPLWLENPHTITFVSKSNMPCFTCKQFNDHPKGARKTLLCWKHVFTNKVLH